MPKPRSHKPTILIFVICLLAVVATAAYVGIPVTQNAGQSSQRAVNTAAPIAQNTFIETDDDWKDIFLDETATSTNLSTAPSIPKASPTEPITLTDRFGRRLLTQYIDLKQAGLSNNTELIESVADNLLSEDFLGDTPPKTYALNDIIIKDDESAKAYKDYGNVVGNIIRLNVPKRNDAYIAQEGIRTGNKNYVKELKANAASYQTIVRLLLKTPVPESLSRDHLDLINGISTMTFISNSLAAYENDPLKSAVSLGSYENATMMMFSGVQGMRKTFKEAGLSYLPTEGGSYFNLHL